MIDFSLLNSIASSLSDYRKDGRDQVLFDSRDHGNYGGYDFERTSNMLLKHDPTGLALGLLLNEMIEATIECSKVRLSRVLREPGFLEHIRGILEIKRRLDDVLLEPRTNLLSRLSAALQSVSSEFETPSSREVAICLRDAIFCMDGGLKLHWLKCDDTPMASHVALSNDICHFPDIATFADTLRNDMEWGAHLARIGRNATAIGIKQPGRVAYLSSLYIDTNNGAMEQNLAHNSHMAEQFDLDTPVQRYPDWFQSPSRPNGTSIQVDDDLAKRMDQHPLNNIAKLPRDRLLWLAMVVEMAAQRMASADSTSVEMCEIAVRALSLQSSSTLPMVISPNWTTSVPKLNDMFHDLHLAPWETRYLEPALDGLDASHFLPVRHETMAINLIEKSFVPWEEDSFLDDRKFSDYHTKIVPAQPDMIGTRAEIESAHQKIFRWNLVNYLMDWGNRQFQKDWIAFEPQFRALLAENLPSALSAGCVTMTAADYVDGYFITLYTQSHRHKGYKPCCYFNGKKPMTHYATFFPESSSDFVEILGLESESELPNFLQGWLRDQSWTTSDRTQRVRNGVPADAGWVFAKQNRAHNALKYARAVVTFNEGSVPESLIKKQG